MPTLLANQIQNSSNGRPWRCSWPIGLMPFISIDQTRSLSGCVVLLICLRSYLTMNICKRDDNEKNNVVLIKQEQMLAREYSSILIFSLWRSYSGSLVRWYHAEECARIRV